MKKRQKEESHKRKEELMMKLSASRQEKYEEANKIKIENAQLLEELR